MPLDTEIYQLFVAERGKVLKTKLSMQHPTDMS